MNSTIAGTKVTNMPKINPGLLHLDLVQGIGKSNDLTLDEAVYLYSNIEPGCAYAHKKKLEEGSYHLYQLSQSAFRTDLVQLIGETECKWYHWEERIRKNQEFIRRQEARWYHDQETVILLGLIFVLFVVFMIIIF